MLPTISKQLRNKRISSDDVPKWTGEELLPFLQQIKRVLDEIYQANFFTTTLATGVFTTIWTSPDLAVGFDWFIEAHITGHEATARSTFIIDAFFYNDGTVAQEGATLAVYTQNTASFDVQFLIVGNHIELQVQDAGGLTVEWQAWIALRETPETT